MKNKTFFWIVAIAVFLILAGVIGVYSNSGFINGTFTIEPSISGNFGTFLNSLLSVFLSTLTVVLIWLTYKSQKSELEETKKVLGKQQFENIFYNLLEAQRSIRKELNIDDYNLATKHSYYSKNKGLTVFDAIRDDFKKYYMLSINKDPTSPNRYIKDDFKYRLENDITIRNDDYSYQNTKKIYKCYFNNIGDKFGHYFRHSYHILNYICENIEEEGEQIKYSDIYQAELSSSELFMHFYNGILFEKMYLKMDNLQFLENLQKKNLIKPNSHSKFYPKTTFK